MKTTSLLTKLSKKLKSWWTDRDIFSFDDVEITVSIREIAWVETVLRSTDFKTIDMKMQAIGQLKQSILMSVSQETHPYK